ncbi:MAG: hypothetical protein ACO1QR_07815 [Chthoniobacteraceae bacterium]
MVRLLLFSLTMLLRARFLASLLTLGTLASFTLSPDASAEPLAVTTLPGASAPRLIDPNVAVLAAIRTMPRGGAYAVDRNAKEKLISSVRLEPRGLILQPKAAQPSFCSGATYLVFLRALEQMARTGGLALNAETLNALLITGQPDGEGIWGRWNANGPGTARLFHELKLGRNFTDIGQARAGDFLKIFWTDEIGSKERGHSVVYLGTEVIAGVDHLRFWSSNQPEGYSVKSVPRTKIARMVFSRLETPGNVLRAAKLNPTDTFLANMLVKRFTMRDVERMCGL